MIDILPALKGWDSYCLCFPVASVGSCFTGVCFSKLKSHVPSTGG